MFWTFLASCLALTAFMIALALGGLFGRRKRECSCQASSRIMAGTGRSDRRQVPRNASDSALEVIEIDRGCCHGRAPWIEDME